MNDSDIQLLGGVINRLGASELTEVLRAIFERLEKIETQVFPSVEEGTGSEEGPSSSGQKSEPTPTQEQRQSY